MMLNDFAGFPVQDRFVSLDGALEKWGGWARGRCGPRYYQCRGLESRYRSGDAKAEAVAAIGAGVPDYVGLEIERVIATLPVWQRDLLVLHYVKRLRKAQITRALAVRFSDFEGHLKQAAHMADNRLLRAGVDIVLKLVL
ncbi:hypothetical protein [Pseudogulbenkiania sp. NH8B]|uniref:hypothetical protein n=1 Tax=Pseudogulbenkiania sp. (strain NH8B) TaxID=748280 RepID=UPI00059FBE2C|nr:hypothetical protein [Pseudogulbenkiania sp. NH8B]